MPRQEDERAEVREVEPVEVDETQGVTQQPHQQRIAHVEQIAETITNINSVLESVQEESEEIEPQANAEAYFDIAKQGKEQVRANSELLRKIGSEIDQAIRKMEEPTGSQVDLTKKIKNLSRRLKEIESLVKPFIKKHQADQKFRKKTRKAEEVGRAALLEEEQAADTDELYDRVAAKREEATKLSKGFGKYTNRKKIAALRAEADRLLKRLNSVTYVDLDNDHYQTSLARYDLPNAVGRVEGTISSAYFELQHQLEQTLDQLAHQEAEEEMQLPAEQVDPMRIAVADKALDNIYDYTVSDQVRTRVHQLMNQYSDVSTYDTFGEAEAVSARRGEFKSEIDRLPHQVQDALRDLWGEDFTDELKKLVAFPDLIQAHTNYQAIMTEQKEVQRALGQSRDLDAEQRPVDVFKDFPFSVWRELKDNSQFRQLIGAERVDQAQEFFAQELKKRLLTTPQHTSESVRCGYWTYQQDDPQFAEYAILNAWRESGGASEYPFLSRYKGSDSDVFQYMAVQLPETLDAVAAANPALGRVIEIMQQHPEDFTKSNLRKTDGAGRVNYTENPTYYELHQNLALAAQELLNRDNEDEQFFAVGVFNRRNAEMSLAVISRLDKIFNSTKNQKLKDEIIEVVRKKIRGEKGDDIYVSFLARHYRELSPRQREAVAWSKSGLLTKALEPEIEGHVLNEVAALLEMSPQSLNDLREIYPQLFDEHYFQNYEVANLKAFIEKLTTADRDRLIERTARVREVDPNFKLNVGRDVDEAGDCQDPFKAFYSHYYGQTHYRQHRKLYEHKLEQGSIPEDFSNAFLEILRENDAVLVETPALQTEIAPETYQRFHQEFQNYLEVIFDPGISNVEQAFFSSAYCLHFVARQPERFQEILGLREKVPKLFKLIDEGGPLNSNLDNVVRDVFSNGNVETRAREIESIFTSRKPYWEQLSFFTEARLGPELAASPSLTPVTEIGGKTWAQWADENPDHLTAVIADDEIRGRVIAGELEVVPFAALRGMQKKAIYRESIRATVEGSRDQELKRAADARNRQDVQENLVFNQRHGAHGTSITNLDPILLSGNIPKESLGVECKTDARPFHFDFWRIDPQAAEGTNRITTPRELVEKTHLGSYSSQNDGIILFYNRQAEHAYQPGREVPGTAQGKLHDVLLGGMPSSEISVIVARNPETIPQIIEKVVENGFYIPVYNEQGELMFTPEEYDQLYLANNLAVPVEVWDFSMRIGDQLGSNPGGTYAVPPVEGDEPDKYYVKFAVEGRKDRVWNEQLADDIYRQLGFAVPDTQIVRSEGNYGHASRWMEHDMEQEMADFQDGFLADCLLANWDIVFERNRAQIEGQTHRMDNGGSLLYRARGERRQEFTRVVTELETMRSSYPDLTNSDIRRQLKKLEDNFTNNDINRLVDGVRLPQEDRDYLKKILRQRRDYILAYYQVEAETAEIPPAGQEIYQLLKVGTINDQVLIEKVPEWERLIGEEGYQHNKALLGEHIKEAVATLKELPGLKELDDREQHLATIAMLFHDIGKPTGRKTEKVERDFGHEIPSAAMAARYMQEWGYGAADIKTVMQVIVNDGVVSDIARGKVREESKNLAPQKLKELLDDNTSTIKVLRVINQADVIATVGESGFAGIEDKYNQYFEEMLAA